MAHQTGLPPSTCGTGLIHLKVLWRRAKTWARKRNCSSVSGASAIDAVLETDFVFHPLRPGQAHLWMSEDLTPLYWFVGFVQALFLG